MRRIVVGFDGSASARAALDWAVAEAELRDVPLQVLTILDPPPRVMQNGPGKDLAALDDVQAAAAELTRGIAAEFRTGSGAVAAELCAACTSQDLLVLGSRGRSPFADILLGSVSRACLQHAPGSVVAVRAHPGPVQTGAVIVGVDASEHSRHALRVAAEEARLRGAALHAVHVVHWDHLGAELIVPTTQQLVTWGRELVETELAQSGVTARSVILDGNPSEELVRQSENAQLLVLGSRGHNPLAALALGSTSAHCVRHSACPVMVVRPSGDDPSPG